ncbi:MAG: hypothetical protein CFH01_02010 [Alphaproteobacteria bacterium MarineAlpha2_Bin1]|nr:MAG: hypothetical protein CFH01_02010 [Alphaproteobacteria bacterium MarineAlpha2_Bin1]
MIMITLNFLNLTIPMMNTKNNFFIIFLLFVSFLFSNNVSGIYNTKESKYAHYTLKIQEIYSDGFKFHVLGTNPSNLNTCNYEGVAYLKGNILNNEKIAISKFKYDTFDYQTEQSIEKKCEVMFVIKNNQIEILSDGCSYYWCGMGASFEHTYFRSDI